MGPDCGANNNECEIFDLVVDPGQCNEDGTYQLYINFEYEGAENDYFDVIDNNGEYIAFFELADLPVTLEHFPASGNAYDYVKVCINDTPGCCANIEFEAPDCAPNGDCNIYDLIYELHECNEEGQFYVDLDFLFSNVGEDGFRIQGNGNNYGNFSYEEEYVTLGPFDGDGQTVYEFIIIDNQHPNCVSNYVEFTAPNCGNNVECDIYDIVVETLECDGEGTYSLILDFEYQNNVSANFSVLDGNGNIIGTYAFADLPVTVQNFPERPNNEYDFIKIIDNDSDCYGVWEFMGPDCGANNNECEIFDLVVDPGQCNEDGTYQLYINFEYEGAENDYFDVIDNNGEYIAFFELADLPVTLENFPASGNAYDYVKVCINDTPGCCADIEFEAPDCEPGLVWPGDANTDRIAQNFDLLNIGLAYGFEGPDRQEMGNDWLGLEAEDWDESFADDVNFKHADCNGDGVVDIEDREAILLNYNETHGTPTPFEPLPSTDLDPPIFVDFPEPGDLENGDAFEVPVILGTEDEPVNDIYGIAFTIEFDPEFIDPESLEIIYPTSWFGEEDINMITLDKKFTDDGKLEVAMTRIDQNDVSGFGQVAMLIGIIDDIAGVHDTEVGISDIHGLAYDQSPVTLKAPSERIVLAPEMPQDTVGWLDLKRSLTIFPNPSNSWVNVHTRHGYDIQELSVLRSDGQEVVPTVVNQSRISIKELPEGIYILRIKVLDEVFHEKIIKAD